MVKQQLNLPVQHSCRLCRIRGRISANLLKYFMILNT
jgi:hypothetical protein